MNGAGLLRHSAATAMLRGGTRSDRAQRPPNHSNNHGRRATRPLYDASAGNEPIPVSLTRSGCSFQSGRASAPMIPQPVQTMRAPNVGAGTSSGYRPALSTAWWSRSQRGTSSDRTPSERMLPSVIGSISLRMQRTKIGRW